MHKLPTLICSILLGFAHNIFGEQSYQWTTEHVQVGVRWQPFGLKNCEIYDANRPLIKNTAAMHNFGLTGMLRNPIQVIRTTKIICPVTYMRSTMR